MVRTEMNGHGATNDEADTFLRPHGEKTSYKSGRKKGFVDKLKTDKEFRHRIIHTSVVCWSFITLV